MLGVTQGLEVTYLSWKSGNRVSKFNIEFLAHCFHLLVIILSNNLWCRFFGRITGVAQNIEMSRFQIWVTQRSQEERQIRIWCFGKLKRFLLYSSITFNQVQEGCELVQENPLVQTSLCWDQPHGRCTCNFRLLVRTNEFILTAVTVFWHIWNYCASLGWGFGFETEGFEQREIPEIQQNRANRA